MTKQQCEGPQDPTGQIHQVEGQNNCRNSPLFDFPKTIDLIEGSLKEEDFPEEEDSPEEEDFLEEEDTLEEEEYRQEDHPEEAGGHH